MKVAVVSPYAFDVPGGVQDQVARLVRWLRAEGDEAWAVAPGTGGPEGTRHVGRFASVPANRSRAPIALNPAVVRRVRAAVADADVVHIHEPLMPFVSLGALIARTPPKVVTFHADPGRLGRAVYRGLRPVVRRMLRRAVATAVSEVAARHVPGDVAIVPNGIDLDAYAGGAERVSGRVAFVGRDDPRKGLDALQAAWVDVVAAVPDATLHVVGSTAADTGSIRYLGRLTEDDKRAELAAAQVFAAPNRGGESFGIVVIEGLAAGCAVVASDLAAFRAVAGDSVVYVPPGEPAPLAEAIIRLLRDGEERETLRERAVSAVAGYGREAVLEGYRTAYRTARSDR